MRKTTLAAVLALGCLTLPLMADGYRREGGNGSPCVPEPSSILGAIAAAGALGGGMLYKRRHKQ